VLSSPPESNTIAFIKLIIYREKVVVKKEIL